MTGLLLIVLLIWAAFGLVGYAIGESKGKARAGFALGFFLGPIGLVIIALLERTPAAEAARQVSVQRALGSTALNKPSGAARAEPFMREPIDGHMYLPRREAPKKSTESLMAAAAGDSEAASLVAAIRTFDRRVIGDRPLQQWFFADGRLPLVVRYESVLRASGASEWLSPLIARGQDARVSFVSTSDGTVQSVKIGNYSFTNPRPLHQVRRFLEQANAVEFRAQVEPQAVAASPHSASPLALTVKESLAALQELKEDGTITEAEFDAKRAEILRRL